MEEIGTFNIQLSLRKNDIDVVAGATDVEAVVPSCVIHIPCNIPSCNSLRSTSKVTAILGALKILESRPIQQCIGPRKREIMYTGQLNTELEVGLKLRGSQI